MTATDSFCPYGLRRGGLSSEQTVPAADPVWDLVTEHLWSSVFSIACPSLSQSLGEYIHNHWGFILFYFLHFVMLKPHVYMNFIEVFCKRSMQSIFLKWHELKNGFIALIWEAAKRLMVTGGAVEDELLRLSVNITTICYGYHKSVSYGIWIKSKHINGSEWPS